MSFTQTSNPRLGTGRFPDRLGAERVYDGVSARGYGSDDVNVAMSDETHDRHLLASDVPRTEICTKTAAGAGIGGAIGGGLGAILAAVVAVGTTISLPGIGLVIAGPVAAAIAGAGAGAAAGGIVGALIGWRIREERVKHYEEGNKNGGNLLRVTPRSPPRSGEDAKHFEKTWRGSEVQNVVGTGMGAAAPAVPDETVGAVVGPVCMVATDGIRSAQSVTGIGIDTMPTSADDVRSQPAPILDKGWEQAHKLMQQGSDALRDDRQLVREKAARASDMALRYTSDQPVKAVLMSAAAGALMMGLVALLARGRD